MLKQNTPILPLCKIIPTGDNWGVTQQAFKSATRQRWGEEGHLRGNPKEGPVAVVM